jgi:hypothetical protein
MKTKEIAKQVDMIPSKRDALPGGFVGEDMRPSGAGRPGPSNNDWMSSVGGCIMLLEDGTKIFPSTDKFLGQHGRNVLLVVIHRH